MQLLAVVSGAYVRRDIDISRWDILPPTANLFQHSIEIYRGSLDGIELSQCLNWQSEPQGQESIVCRNMNVVKQGSGHCGGHFIGSMATYYVDSIDSD